MITVNLLPVSNLRTQSQGKIFLSGYAIFMVVVLGGLFSINSNILEGIRDELTDQKSKLEISVDQTTKKVKAAAELSSDTVQRWKQLEAVVELEERRRDQTRLLVEVEGLLPKSNAWLLSLSHTNGLLSIKGLSTDKETVSQLLTRLENADYIDRYSVNLDQVSQNMVLNGVKLTEFSINARTVFPKPQVIIDGLPEFGLPARAEFLKIVKAADENLAKDLEGAADAKNAKKGI